MTTPRVSEKSERRGPLSRQSAELRDRLRVIALDLFERKGFDSATADDIAAVAGISRRTFFRYFLTKEDAIFSDQHGYLNQLSTGLEFGIGEPIVVAGHALTLILDGLLSDSDYVRRRDAIVIATPALADREVVWWGEYQYALGHYLSKNSSGPRELMFAQIVAAAILAAFRQVITQWLRSDHAEDPKALFGELIDDIADSMTVTGPRGTGPAPSHPDSREIVIISSDLTGEQIAELIDKRRS